MKEKSICAIIYCEVAQVNKKQFLKYHLNDFEEKTVAKFLNFAARFPGVRHVNFYDSSRNFIKQIRIKKAN